MIDNDRLKFIRYRLDRCKNILGAESRLIKGSGDTYGIEFDDEQTFKIDIKPIFDMDEDEIISFLELVTYGVPMIPELIAEMDNLEAGMKALVEAIATIAIIASRKRYKETGSKDIEESVNIQAPTIGEK